MADRVWRCSTSPPPVPMRVEGGGTGFLQLPPGDGHPVAAHAAILEQGPAYGRATFGKGTRVNVEFVSANPTGPLHVGHGRGAAQGDGIAALLEWTGHEVVREFYINDAGVQITRLAESLWARIQQASGREASIPEGGYHGAYLVEAGAAISPVRAGCRPARGGGRDPLQGARASMQRASRTRPWRTSGCGRRAVVGTQSTTRDGSRRRSNA